MTDQRPVVRSFLVSWSVLAASALIALLTTEKLKLHATLNSHHTPWADAFFTNFTHLADGLVPTAIALLLLFTSNLRSFLLMALSCSLSAIVLQTLKHTLFIDMDRPSMFRDQLVGMDWVDGVELHRYFSFPSGHSTAAFSMCLSLAVIIGARYGGVLWVLVAALLAFSRVYLSQHFLQDALAGSALGTLTALLVYHVLYRSTFAERAWLDRRILRKRRLVVPKEQGARS